MLTIGHIYFYFFLAMPSPTPPLTTSCLPPQFGGTELQLNEITPELMKKQMSDADWNKIFEMSRDKNLYQNLINSLFPAIHGNDEVKKGECLECYKND